MSDNEKAPFDPNAHLTKVNGNDYLEVRWRVKWLRNEAPDSQIITELIEVSPQFALFKTTATKIIDGEVKGVATGHGSETPGDFRDYIEKAEQKSIGRALAHLGYGTQFIEGEAPSGRIVNSPVNRPRATTNGSVRRDPGEVNAGTTNSIASIGPDEAATQRQLRYLQAVAREAGMDGAGLDERSEIAFGIPAAQLTRRDCSTLIDLIQSENKAVTS